MGFLISLFPVCFFWSFPLFRNADIQHFTIQRWQTQRLTEVTRYPGFPMLKGLQQHLEFMGIQGCYIFWAAGDNGAGSRGQKKSQTSLPKIIF